MTLNEEINTLESFWQDMTDELRIYIVFRADLPEMTRAKGEVQAGHAVGSLIYDQMWKTGVDRMIADYRNDKTRLSEIDRTNRTLEAYFFGNSEDVEIGSVAQAKINLEVDDVNSLMTLYQNIQAADIPVVRIRDEGRTVFKEPTLTCIAFGPVRKSVGMQMTKGLRLRK